VRDTEATARTYNCCISDLRIHRCDCAGMLLRECPRFRIREQEQAGVITGSQRAAGVLPLLCASSWRPEARRLCGRRSDDRGAGRRQVVKPQRFSGW
jgi:hypothetical protein